jgi:Rod binding domain-containing protein
MEVSPLQNRSKEIDLPLDRLSHNPNVSEAEKLHEVGRQFEAVLLRQILQSAQKPLFPSQCALNSSVNSIYQDMTTTQLAESISQSGSFGLARSLETQLTAQLAARTAADEPSAGQNTQINPHP